MRVVAMPDSRRLADADMDCALRGRFGIIRAGVQVALNRSERVMGRNNASIPVDLRDTSLGRVPSCSGSTLFARFPMASHDANHAAYLKGDSLWKKGRFNEAARCFLDAIAARPEDYQSFWALGNCYAELKKPRKAEQSFRQAVALCPNADKPALLFNLANMLFDQKRYASAIALYAQIPSSHPLSRRAERNAFLAENRR